MRESTQDSVLWEQKYKSSWNPKALAMSVYLYKCAYLCLKMNIMLQVGFHSIPEKATLSSGSATNS